MAKRTIVLDGSPYPRGEPGLLREAFYSDMNLLKGVWYKLMGYKVEFTNGRRVEE
jgi:hypothetical protein